MALVGTLDVSASADSVTFSFTVRNDGDDPVELSFSDAQTHDVVVLDDGTEVWRWSQGRMFAQMLQSETLGPDDAVTYDVEWSDPASGDYEAVATLAARNHDVEARERFSV